VERSGRRGRRQSAEPPKGRPQRLCPGPAARQPQDRPPPRAGDPPRDVEQPLTEPLGRCRPNRALPSPSSACSPRSRSGRLSPSSGPSPTSAPPPSSPASPPTPASSRSACSPPTRAARWKQVSDSSIASSTRRSSRTDPSISSTAERGPRTGPNPLRRLPRRRRRAAPGRAGGPGRRASGGLQRQRDDRAGALTRSGGVDSSEMVREPSQAFPAAARIRPRILVVDPASGVLDVADRSRARGWWLCRR
jgi:hypothetical protein